MTGSNWRGLVIALEGGISGRPEGTLFNVENWVSNKWDCDTLIKEEEGCVGFLSFERLTEILTIIESRKKLMKASQKCIGEREDSLNHLTIDDF